MTEIYVIYVSVYYEGGCICLVTLDFDKAFLRYKKECMKEKSSDDFIDFQAWDSETGEEAQESPKLDIVRKWYKESGVGLR